MLVRIITMLNNKDAHACKIQVHFISRGPGTNIASTDRVQAAFCASQPYSQMPYGVR